MTNTSFGLGGVLVVIGMILVLIAALLGNTGGARLYNPVLAAGVLLMGAGILCGHTAISSS